MLHECRKVVNSYELPEEDGKGINSSFLRQSRAQKYGAVFQNVTMASLHLRAMLHGSLASNIPDLPNTRSAMVILFGDICDDPISPKDLDDWPQPGAFRAPLQLAALISPIVLLSQIRLDSSCFDKEDLLNVSLTFAMLHTDKFIIVVRARARERLPVSHETGRGTHVENDPLSSHSKIPHSFDGGRGFAAHSQQPAIRGSGFLDTEPRWVILELYMDYLIDLLPDLDIASDSEKETGKRKRLEESKRNEGEFYDEEENPQNKRLAVNSASPVSAEMMFSPAAFPPAAEPNLSTGGNEGAPATHSQFTAGVSSTDEGAEMNLNSHQNVIIGDDTIAHPDPRLSCGGAISSTRYSGSHTSFQAI